MGRVQFPPSGVIKTVAVGWDLGFKQQVFVDEVSDLPGPDFHLRSVLRSVSFSVWLFLSLLLLTALLLYFILAAPAVVCSDVSMIMLSPASLFAFSAFASTLG